jgi:phosphate transport system substrate-binding protein
MTSHAWYTLLAACGIGCLVAWNTSASAQALRIQGSSSVSNDAMGPYQSRIEKLAGHKLTVSTSTSGEGLLALLKGEADLAMISASLDSMIELLRKTAPDLPFGRLREFRISQARVAFPVNPANPVRSVSLSKLKQILGGQIGNWRELGGPDLPIHVISLREGGGAKRATEESLFGGQRLTPRSEIVVDSSLKVVQTVARDRGALGIAQANLVKHEHLPELQTKVPVARSYSFVSLDEPTEPMRAVIAAARNIIFEEEP